MQIQFSPFTKTYSSAASAIQAAKKENEHTNIKNLNRDVVGNTITDSLIGLGECAIHLSSERWLVIHAVNGNLTWRLQNRWVLATSPFEDTQFTTTNGKQTWRCNPTAMLRSLVGSKVTKLFLTDGQLLLYTTGNEILWLCPAYNATDHKPIILPFFSK